MLVSLSVDGFAWYRLCLGVHVVDGAPPIPPPEYWWRRSTRGVKMRGRLRASSFSFSPWQSHRLLIMSYCKIKIKITSQIDCQAIFHRSYHAWTSTNQPVSLHHPNWTWVPASLTCAFRTTVPVYYGTIAGNILNLLSFLSCHHHTIFKMHLVFPVNVQS